MSAEKFKVVPYRDGFLVAARHAATGALVATSDYPTRELAEAKAERLNALHEQVQSGCIVLPTRLVQRIPARAFEAAAA